jgi:hypothetical protein
MCGGTTTWETETGMGSAMLTTPLTVPMGMTEQRVQEANRPGPHDAGSPTCGAIREGGRCRFVMHAAVAGMMIHMA